MDAEGYLPLALIASFNRVIALSADIALVIAAVKESDKLEVYNDYKVRTKIDPTKWPLSGENPTISTLTEMKPYAGAKSAPIGIVAGYDVDVAAGVSVAENGTDPVVPLSNPLSKIPPPPVLKNPKKKPTTNNAATTTTNNNTKVDNNNTSSSVQPLQLAVVCK
jgi:la-related protein 1